MKFVSCSVVFFIFVSMGFFVSAQMEKRLGQLKSLERGLSFMEREIDYHGSSLSDVLRHTAGRIEHPWNLFFERAGEALKTEKEGKNNPEAVFQKELDKVRPYHPWDKDLEVLKALGKRIGSLDKKMQLLELCEAKEEMKRQIREAEEEKGVKGKLYRTLGLCMGFLGVILIL